MKVLRGKGRDESGFTLVELLMVMVIIGVLAGIGFTGMNMLQTRALVTKADTNWRVLDSAVKMFLAEGGEFGENNAGIVVANAEGAAIADAGKLDATYLDVDDEVWSSAVSTWVSGDADCDLPEEVDPNIADGLYYCVIEDWDTTTAGNQVGVYVWYSDGDRVGTASNNPSTIVKDVVPEA